MLGRTLSTAFATFALVGSSCCCCSTDWLDLPEEAQPADEPEIERQAREYARQNAHALLEGPDAGPGSSECFSGGAALALDFGVAVISRGHAGSSAAGQVSFNPGACARRIVVYVVERAAAWVVAGAIVYDRLTGLEIRRLGDPPSNFTAAYSSTDTDDDIDELF